MGGGKEMHHTFSQGHLNVSECNVLDWNLNLIKFLKLIVEMAIGKCCMPTFLIPWLTLSSVEILFTKLQSYTEK